MGGSTWDFLILPLTTSLNFAKQRTLNWVGRHNLVGLVFRPLLDWLITFRFTVCEKVKNYGVFDRSNTQRYFLCGYPLPSGKRPFLDFRSDEHCEYCPWLLLYARRIHWDFHILENRELCFGHPWGRLVHRHSRNRNAAFLASEIFRALSTGLDDHGLCPYFQGPGAIDLGRRPSIISRPGLPSRLYPYGGNRIPCLSIVCDRTFDRGRHLTVGVQ